MIEIEISAQELKKKMGLKDGQDGLTPTADELIALIKPLIPTPLKGDKGETPDVSGLEQQIKNLQDKIKTLSSRPLGRAIGPSVITPRPLNNITPTGAINGVNTAFTLPKAPKTDGERVYLNGVRMRSGASNDYTIAGRTITFNTAPLTNDIILVDIDY